MEIIKQNLGSKFSEIEVIPFSDIHIGANVDYKILKDTIKYIEDTPNAYTMLNGDLLNNAIKTSVSDIYSEFINPDAQLEKLVELFKPIKHKILCVLSGNHEDRTWKLTGIDIVKNFCYRLRIEDRYSSGNVMMFLSFGNKRGELATPRPFTFSLYAMHGSGGGKLIGGKMNTLERMSGIVDADIYLHSHTHTPATFKLDFIRVNHEKKSVKQVTKLFVNTNAWLEYGGYGEVKGYKPSTITPVKIKLKGIDRNKQYATCEL